jgi:hypothetical protein
MTYHPAEFAAAGREVIGAWLICVGVAAGCFGLPPLAAAFDGDAAAPPATVSRIIASTGLAARPGRSCEPHRS